MTAWGVRLMSVAWFPSIPSFCPGEAGQASPLWAVQQLLPSAPDHAEGGAVACSAKAFAHLPLSTGWTTRSSGLRLPLPLRPLHLALRGQFMSQTLHAACPSGSLGSRGRGRHPGVVTAF